MINDKAATETTLTNEVTGPNGDTDANGSSASKPRRGPLRRWTRRAVRLAAVLFLSPLVISFIVAAVVLDRDITAPTWIKNRVEASAADVLSGGTLVFGEITVNVGRDLHPRVTLRDALLKDAAGTAIVRIPVVRALMSPRGLLLQGDALMQDVQLSGVQINLRRDADGTVALAFETGGAAIGQAENLAELLDRSDQIFEQPALAALETIRADGLIINYQDARAGKAWTVDGGQINLDLRDAKTDLRGTFSLLSGGAGVTDLSLSYASTRGSRAADFSITITDALASDIAAQSAALSWMSDIDAPISATMRTTLNEAGALGPLNATLALGKGALQPNTATEPIHFEAAKAYLNFDPVTNTINFDQVEIASDWGQFNATGQAFLQDIKDGLPQSFVGQFAFTDTEFNPLGLYADPLSLPNLQVDMQLRLDPFAIDLGQVFVQADDVTVLGGGRLAATYAGWDVAIDAQIGVMDHVSMLQLWPATMMESVRQWMDAQVPAATYNDFHLAYRKRPGQATQVAGNFAFEDTEVRFLNSMPPIINGAGVGSFTSDTFVVTLDDGIVTAPIGDIMTAAGSTLVMPDLSLDPRPAEYDLNLRGSLTAALSLMDLPPMGYTSLAGLRADAADGGLQLNIKMTHPMKSGIVSSEVGVEVNAVLNNLSSRSLIPNRNLTADRLTLFADKTKLEIAGLATVDGVEIDGTWVQRFDGSGSRLQAGLRLSEQSLAAFDVALPPGTVAGSSAGRLDLRIPSGGVPRYTVTSDLRGVRVAIPAVAWSKARQTPGNLKVSGRLGTDPQVENLEIAGVGLDAQGDVTFGADGSLGRARFSRVQVGNWLDAPITLRGRGGNRPVAVEIRGGSIDLRQASFGTGGDDSGAISIALDRLEITEGIALTRLVGEFTGASGFAGEFTARVNDAVDVRGTVVPSNGQSAVRLVGNDFGGVARATGLMTTAVGGSFDLTLLPADGAGTFDGALAVRGLRIREAPAMAALLDAISVVGLLQQLDGQGIAFDEVDARFQLTPQQIILTQSSAVGPGLGISLDGLYTLATNQMDFQGVISPLYLINSIGAIFTRRGEGLIGFNFNITGTASEPKVSVNPFSALTPGMFRNIFRRAPPQVPE
ncbi:MAG: hypothetical protein ACI9ND_000456 [Yoonia sp.]|jgi:hypothetical protein